MASAHEAFWTHSSYAFVGHSAKKKGFPRISYGEAKKGGMAGGRIAAPPSTPCWMR